MERNRAMTSRPHGYLEASARARLGALVDEQSFVEFLPPAARMTSPHLQALDLPVSFDDGVIIGQARIDGNEVLIAAQEGRFMGGAVGEVHGAKLTGLLKRALAQRPAGVVLLLESGGVRLHEANAGLVAVSEVMRAVLEVRASGIPVIAAIGGAFGCFGGMGIVACCCDSVIASEEGRLGMSGPEVIESAHGVEEFDSRDRALVWRTTGAKHRYLLGDVDALVADEIAAFREAIQAALTRPKALTLDALEAGHRRLAKRLSDFSGAHDALEIWRALGIASAETLPSLDTVEFLSTTSALRREGAYRKEGTHS
jgi:malonate decarboxylase beta subunit